MLTERLLRLGYRAGGGPPFPGYLPFGRKCQISRQLSCSAAHKSDQGPPFQASTVGSIANWHVRPSLRQSKDTVPFSSVSMICWMTRLPNPRRDGGVTAGPPDSHERKPAVCLVSPIHLNMARSHRQGSILDSVR